MAEEDALDRSFRVGHVRVDCNHQGNGKFSVSIYPEELEHGDVVCAIRALKRAEAYVAQHCPND